jgi:hypothetical protein
MPRRGIAKPSSWKPGQSGNPSGKPRYSPDGTDLRALARGHTVECIEMLLTIMRNPRSLPSARVAAAIHILDRGWGKPAVTVSANVDLPNVFVDFRADMTVAEWLERFRPQSLEIDANEPPEGSKPC